MLSFVLGFFFVWQEVTQTPIDECHFKTFRLRVFMACHQARSNEMDYYKTSE